MMNCVVTSDAKHPHHQPNPTVQLQQHDRNLDWLRGKTTATHAQVCLLIISGFPCILESHGTSWNLRKEFSRPGKLWKMTVVMESQGIPP